MTAHREEKIDILFAYCRQDNNNAFVLWGLQLFHLGLVSVPMFSTLRGPQHHHDHDHDHHQVLILYSPFKENCVLFSYSVFYISFLLVGEGVCASYFISSTQVYAYSLGKIAFWCHGIQRNVKTVTSNLHISILMPQSYETCFTQVTQT